VRPQGAQGVEDEIAEDHGKPVTSDE
jgi:hypothetical protein